MLLLAAAVLLVVVSGAAALEAARDLHQLIELAQSRAPSRGPTPSRPPDQRLPIVWLIANGGINALPTGFLSSHRLRRLFGAQPRSHNRGSDKPSTTGAGGLPDMAMPTALEISRQATLKPITEIAEDVGIPPWLIEQHGEHVAKIDLKAIEELEDRPKAKYVVVTAITPTPLGEGKTTTTIGLGMAFRHIGKKATIAIRQASMGPTFGIKGGAAGGGYSQAVPFELLNLHLTGDMHAVTAAHNQIAAMVDNSLYMGNPFGLDLNQITWRRVIDINDRALRNIVIGLGAAGDGVPRQAGFDITAASEVMAVLALSK